MHGGVFDTSDIQIYGRPSFRFIGMESLTSEQRYEKRMERMDHQIAIQNSMKSILTESQFENWKKIHAKGHKSMQKDKGKRKMPDNPKHRKDKHQQRP